MINNEEDVKTYCQIIISFQNPELEKIINLKKYYILKRSLRNKTVLIPQHQLDEAKEKDLVEPDYKWYWFDRKPYLYRIGAST